MTEKNDIFLYSHRLGNNMKAFNPFIVIFAALILTLLAGTAFAATLHGSIYDIELNELNGVVVEVDSSPSQRYVSKDGAYSFELNPGEYILTARYSSGYDSLITSEKVSITAEGDFVFDLFLFPGLDTENSEYLSEENVFDVPAEIVDDVGVVSGLTIAIIVVVFIIILLIIYYAVGNYKKKVEEQELEEVERLKGPAKQLMKDQMDYADSHKKELKSKYADMDHDLHKVIEIIKNEGGRTTQKELRKNIPLSEAKISLMVSELEHKGVVSKVKKGRGNIIILKKK